MPIKNVLGAKINTNLQLLGFLVLLLILPVTVFVVVNSRSPQAPASTSQPSTPLIEKLDGVVISERKVCNLVGTNQTGVKIVGEDGGASARLGSTSYFTFGDTVLNASPMLPNSSASTLDQEASDCITMTSKSSASTAVPTLPKVAGECTVWPTDIVSAPDNRLHYFFSSLGASCQIQHIGIAEMNQANMDSTRVVPVFFQTQDPQIPNYKILSAALTRSGGEVYVFFGGQTISNSRDVVLLGKVAAASIANKGAYTYWNGTDFQANPGAMVPLWDQGEIGNNGLTIRFNQFLGKWTAFYNTGYVSIMSMRTADNVTGPWSNERTVINCLQHFPLGSSGNDYLCYGAREYPHYEKNSGQILYLVQSNTLEYKPFLHEVIFGKAVNQWVDSLGNASYKFDGQVIDNWSLEGSVFYASPNPLSGYSEIFEWENSSGERVLSVSSPGTGFTNLGRAFYASTSPKYSLAPIYQWNKGGLHRYSNLDLSQYGYSKGQTVFYAKVTSYIVSDSKVYPQTGSLFQIGVKDSRGSWVSNAKIKELGFSGLISARKYSIVTNTPFLGNRFFGQNLSANSSGALFFSGELGYVNILNVGVIKENQVLDNSSNLFTYWVHNTGIVNSPPEIGHQLNPYSRAGNIKSFFLTGQKSGNYEGVVCQPDCSASSMWSGAVDFCNDNLTLTPTGATECSQLSRIKLSGLIPNSNYRLYYCSPNCDDSVAQIIYSKDTDTNGELLLTNTQQKLGDINGDENVNSADLAILISTWGSTTDLRADINGNGRVESADLAQLISKWGS